MNLIGGGCTTGARFSTPLSLLVIRQHDIMGGGKEGVLRYAPRPDCKAFGKNAWNFTRELSERGGKARLVGFEVEEW
jgi:hypothetical protein